MIAEQDCRDYGGFSRRWSTAARTGTLAGVTVLTALTIVVEVEAHPARDSLLLDIAVGLVACALLPVLLRRPVPAGVALAVLAALSPAATPPATAGALVVAQRSRFPVAAAVAVAGIVAHAVQGLWRPVGGISYPWWLALMIVGYAALLGWGALTRARRQLMASLRARARRAEAEQAMRVAEARTLERTRIAREMHDVLAHRLSLVATYAGALEYRPDSSPEQLSAAAGVVRAAVHQALDELREVINVLRDSDDGDEAEATGKPQPGLADIPALVDEAREAGQQIAFDSRLDGADAIPALAGRTAFRVVQEGLTNARKHATGQPVTVVLDGRPGGTLMIDVANPVTARAPGPSDAPGNGTGTGTGTGLVGLAERVSLAGGRLEHGVSVGKEFTLRVELPWRA